MRTAIMFGCTIIADAINQRDYKPETYQFIGAVIVCMMIMDIIDFTKNLSKK
jgi:hypothetical protein